MANYCFKTLTVSDFLKKIKQPNFEDLVNQEFEQIKNVSMQGTINNFSQKKNLYKNRYYDIPCWDHSRVTLASQGTQVHDYSNSSEPGTIVVTNKDSDSTYIHANFVDGFEDGSKYICCQGPTEHTAGDFWTLIWQRDTRIIVSLTETDDKDNVCYEYWVSTEGYQLVFGRYIVKTLKIEEEFGFTRTQLRLTDVTSEESREITHFWYTNWPNYNTPTNLKEFVSLLSKVNQQLDLLIMRATCYNLPEPGPTVVHCSAGVGRTGTFCVINNAVDQLKKEKTVSLQNTVLKVRKMRHSSVFTPGQYMFCYKVIEYMLLTENKGDGNYQSIYVRNSKDIVRNTEQLN